MRSLFLLLFGALAYWILGPRPSKPVVRGTIVPIGPATPTPPNTKGTQ